jgi:hypothetical protein
VALLAGCGAATPAPTTPAVVQQTPPVFLTKASSVGTLSFTRSVGTLSSSVLSAVAARLVNVTRTPPSGTIQSGLHTQSVAAGLSLQYHGGPTSSGATQYNLLVNCNDESCWGGKLTAAENAYSRSTMAQILSQYTGGLSSSVTSTGPDQAVQFPNGAIDVIMAGVLAMIDADINGGCNTAATLQACKTPLAGYNHIYHIVLPQNMGACLLPTNLLCGGFCGIHLAGDIANTNGPGGRTHLLWTVETYPQAPCGETGTTPNGTVADSMASLISHEYSEAMTDPDENGWYHPVQSSSGDIGWAVGEIGDLCENLPTNVVNLSGSNWDIQGEYSNSLGDCTYFPQGAMVGLSTGSTFGTANNWTTGLPAHGTDGTYFADVTGSHQAAAIQVNDTGISVALVKGRASTGNPIYVFAPPVPWTSSGFHGYGAPPLYGTYFADIEGIGRADAIAVNGSCCGNGVWVSHNTGSSFSGSTQWASLLQAGSADSTSFADVTGNGKADLLQVTDNTIDVSLSNGSSFGAPIPWSGSFHGYGSPPAYGTYFADIEGIGRADAIAVNGSCCGNGVWVSHNTGSSFSGSSQWASLMPGLVATYFADVNGDGKADLIEVTNTGVYVALSTGANSFAAAAPWINSMFVGSLGDYFADVNGDGRADAILLNQ